MLEPHHLAHLRESGLSDQTIEEAGIFTEIDVAPLINCPEGVARQLGPCIVFPFVGLDGSNGYYRIRPDRPRISKNKPAKYESPWGQPNRVYFPARVREKINNETLKSILITEGEKKALKATQEGADCIGLVGVDAWQREGKMLPELAAIKWRGIHVWVCYDSDAATNPRVMSAEQNLAKALAGKGAIVYIARIPSPDGRKYGIDDYLVKFGVDAFREVLSNAEQMSARDGLSIISASELAQGTPPREAVICGVLRRGQVAYMPAPTKMKKTYMALGMGISVSHGQPWLSFDVQQGRVLYVDNELEQQDIRDRYFGILSELQLPHTFELDFVSLRGEDCDVNAFWDQLLIEPGDYSLVIIDALYHMLPDDCEENSNPHMTRIMRRFVREAGRLNTAIALIHHTSKGEQGDKNVRDLGSGAGAMARAADTLITFRPHEQPNCAVMEFLTRTFADPAPITIKFDFPLWYATTMEPAVKQRKTAMEIKKEARDKEADAEVLTIVREHKPISRRAIRQHTDMGRERIESALARLKKGGLITMRDEGKIQVYEPVPAH